jgi:SAM-dependent methyltransferase
MEYRVSDEVWREKSAELERWRERYHVEAVKVSEPAYKEYLATVNIPPGSRVLDIGCADGMMRQCLPEGVDYQGIDPFPKAEVSYIRKGRAEDIPFDDETFDYVICFASLFHFQDLNLSFREMARVINKGGMLLIMVIIKGERDPSSRSHTFRITHEMMDELSEMAGLTRIFKWEIPKLGSWFYGWQK